MENELREKLARRFWGLISWNAGINPTTDGVPITFDDDSYGLRAFCRTLSGIALETITDEEPQVQHNKSKVTQ